MKEVPFKERFNPGDIICSDRFRNGLCMVVEEFKTFQWKSGKIDEYYSCVDFLNDDEEYPQSWCAHEYDTFKTDQYDWRIATDDDIVNYLLTIFFPLRHECGNTVFTITEEYFCVSGDYRDSVFFNKKEAKELKKKLNEWIDD